MGQYFIVCNVTKQEMLSSTRFGDDMKFTSIAGSRQRMMAAVAILLRDSYESGGGDITDYDNPIVGSWTGDHVVIAGDYAQPGKFLEDQEIKKYWNEVPWTKYEKERGIRDAPNLYHYADEYFTDISDKVVEVMKAEEDWGYAQNNYTFIELTQDIREREIQKALKLLGVKYDINWENVTPQDLRWQFSDAERHGPEFFNWFKKELLKKKLNKETREFVKKQIHFDERPDWKAERTKYEAKWHYKYGGTIEKEGSFPHGYYADVNGKSVPSPYGPPFRTLEAAKKWVEAQYK